MYDESMRPLIGLFAVAVVFGAVVGAGAGVVLFGADAGPTLEAPGPEMSGSGEPTGSVSENDRSDLYERTVDSMATIRVDAPTGSSQGSGFLYEDSYIITNQHVVEDASDVSVQFSDGIWRSGTVVGTDVYTDLAVVRAESIPEAATPLPVADRMPEPGQPVAAFGSPFGLQGTITHGIVSGVNRSMEVGDGFSIPDTVQTDAPINPGNSGGPLVSMNGTVVGVNRVKGGDNVGFAISAQVLERVVPELIAAGHVDHSFMGIRSIPVTPNVADANGVPEAAGIAVVEVLPDGPSAGILHAGTLEDGTVPDDADVIVGIDGTAVRSHEDLTRYLLLHTRPGETTTLTIYRDGERMQVEIELGERPPPGGIS